MVPAGLEAVARALALVHGATLIAALSRANTPRAAVAFIAGDDAAPLHAVVIIKVSTVLSATARALSAALCALINTGVAALAARAALSLGTGAHLPPLQAVISIVVAAELKAIA